MVSFIGQDTSYELDIGFYLKIRDTTFIITDLKYEHMNDTPMHHDFKWMQRFKKDDLFKNALP